MTMYYLVECDGKYEDYREVALEFSEDLDKLEEKAEKYNKAVQRVNNLCNTEGKKYYNKYKSALDLESSKISLDAFIEKPYSTPKTKEEHKKYKEIKDLN